MAAPLVVPHTGEPVSTAYRSEVNGAGSNTVTIAAGYWCEVAVFCNGAEFDIDGSVMCGFNGPRYELISRSTSGATIVHTVAANRMIEVEFGTLTNAAVRYNGTTTITRTVNAVGDRIYLTAGDEIITTAGVTDFACVIRYIDNLVVPTFQTFKANENSVLTINSTSESGFGYFHVYNFSEIT